MLSTAQLLAAGWTRGQIRSRLDREEWRLVQRGVVAEVAMAKPTAESPAAEHALRTAAALLVAGSGVWAAGGSAACLLGLEVLGNPPTRVVLSRDRQEPSLQGSDNRGTRSGRRRRLVSHTPPDHVIEVAGVPCTTPARTAVDLARASGTPAAVVALDSAARQFGVSLAELREVAALQAGWPYAKRVSTALDLMDERTESVLETLGRLALPPDWPRPLSQAWVGELEPEFRVDFLVPGLWIVGEGDGKLKYGVEESLWNEKRRQDRVEDLGWTFVRFDWNEAYAEPHALTQRFLSASCRTRPGRGRIFAEPAWWLEKRRKAQAAARAHPAWWLSTPPP